MQRSPRINLGRCSKRSFGHEKKARKSFRSIVGDLRFPLFCYLISLKNGWIGPILAKKWTFFKFFKVKWKFWWWFWNQWQKWDEPFARKFWKINYFRNFFFSGFGIEKSMRFPNFFFFKKPPNRKILANGSSDFWPWFQNHHQNLHLTSKNLKKVHFLAKIGPIQTFFREIK